MNGVLLHLIVGSCLLTQPRTFLLKLVSFRGEAGTLYCSAWIEFLSEVAYYNDREATPSALAFPVTGSPASKNAHRVFVTDFPFALLYRQDKDGIVVFAIAHLARRPEYRLPRIHDRQHCHATVPPPSISLKLQELPAAR